MLVRDLLEERLSSSTKRVWFEETRHYHPLFFISTYREFGHRVKSPGDMLEARGLALR